MLNTSQHNKEQTECKEADISTELMERLINATQSKSTTAEEHALGFFTRKKPKTLGNMGLVARW